MSDCRLGERNWKKSHAKPKRKACMILILQAGANEKRKASPLSPVNTLPHANTSHTSSPHTLSTSCPHPVHSLYNSHFRWKFRHFHHQHMKGACSHDVHHCRHGLHVIRGFVIHATNSAKVPSCRKLRSSNLLMLALVLVHFWVDPRSGPQKFCTQTKETPPCLSV